jgi:hypothetical protein
VIVLLCVSAGSVGRATASDDCDSPHQIVLRRPFVHHSGHAYYVSVPHLYEQANKNDGIQRSQYILCENGFAIGQPHAMLDDMQKKGGGIYNHYMNNFLFSSSDNSNPNRNRRRYTIVAPAKSPIEGAQAELYFTLEINGDEGTGVAEVLGLITDYTVARAAYEAAVKERPGKKITLRRGGQVLLTAPAKQAE